jgi:3'(2'), 5'-bisphosphate nucleotidase
VTRPDRRLLDAVVAVAETAGRAILRIYASDFAVQRKPDASPVTCADLAADACIAQGLGDLLPGVPVLSEEGAIPPPAVRGGWDTYWLVDPLDGTVGFVGRTGEFSVNIALVEGHRPVLGVVLGPARGILYAAARGLGAWRRQAGATAAPIRTRPWDPALTTLATSPSRRNPRTLAFIEALGDPEVLRLGSALKPCLVAEGRADVYPGFSPTSEWDTAAAQCVVEEAGGRFTDLDLRPLAYNLRAGLENPPFLVFGDPRTDWRTRIPAP